MTNSFRLLLVVICASYTGVLWSQVSTKGNWTTQDKFNAIADLNQQRHVFETFLDSNQVDPLIQCIADQLEQTFENPDAVDTQSDTIQAISEHCLEAVGFHANRYTPQNPSVKGNWNEKDINATFDMLEITRPSMNEIMPEENVYILFDCIMGKLENSYENLDEALDDDNQAMSMFVTDCITENNLIEESEMPDESTMIKEEFGDPDSDFGNWSDADKAALEEQLSELRPKFEAQIGKEKTDLVLECVRFNFEHAFKNYADINNHPEVYKAILDECNQKGQ